MDLRFADLYMVDSTRTLGFFATCLGDVISDDTSDRERLTRDEFLYVSSILAHYAMVESGSPDFLPIPGTLRQLHDMFVTNVDTWQDPDLMETAASQALMLTGYFGAAMRARHQLTTYVRWGRFFYDRAARGHKGKKHELMSKMGERFPWWRNRLERLHTELWERPLRLDLPQPEPRGPFDMS